MFFTEKIIDHDDFIHQDVVVGENFFVIKIRVQPTCLKPYMNI